MGDFVYVREKETGKVYRLLSKPFLGQNSKFDLLSEEEGEKIFAPKKAARVVEPKKPAAPKKVTPAPEPVLDTDEFSAGLTDGDENSR